MMFPREAADYKQLMFVCKSCGNEEFNPRANVAGMRENIVFQDVIKKEAEMRVDAVDSAVVFDPTLPRTNTPGESVCPACGHYQAVFFQADAGKDADMALVFVCTSCRHKWMMHG